MIQDSVVLLITDYGYIGLFIAIVLGVVGLPIPDEILMTIVGYLSFKGHLFYSYTILVAFLGSLTGMSLSFLIGYRYGLPFIEKYGRYLHLTSKKMKRVKAIFEKKGKYAVSIGYFIPGIRYMTGYLAGISRWSFKSFLIYAIPGALLWVWSFISLGYFFGLKWVAILKVFDRYALIFAIIVIIGTFIAWKYRSKVSNS